MLHTLQRVHNKAEAVFDWGDGSHFPSVDPWLFLHGLSQKFLVHTYSTYLHSLTIPHKGHGFVAIHDDRKDEQKRRNKRLFQECCREGNICEKSEF